MGQYIGVSSITQLCACVIKLEHSKEVTLCGKNDFPCHKELLLKERICSLWKQILSFQRSSHYEKGRNEENHCLIQ